MHCWLNRMQLNDLNPLVQFPYKMWRALNSSTLPQTYSVMRDLVQACGKYCPKAMILDITTPVNSTVPSVETSGRLRSATCQWRVAGREKAVKDQVGEGLLLRCGPGAFVCSTPLRAHTCPTFCCTTCVCVGVCVYVCRCAAVDCLRYQRPGGYVFVGICLFVGLPLRKNLSTDFRKIRWKYGACHRINC